MAGNIVKWWKHKILGGYKQFTVLQECATDSEELIYPIRAPSTCSAPPDLLLTGDREPLDGSRMSHGMAKEVKITAKPADGCGVDAKKMILEEFTWDVSVESGKAAQPLQFSFTFYDLDGHHHGKITKDDIAGIVYTIYESLGKSVVVPYCGSKTINVRLTVSPDTNVMSSNKKQSAHVISRKYRYKSKKLIPAEEDDVIPPPTHEADNDCDLVTLDNAEPRVPPTTPTDSPIMHNLTVDYKNKLHISETEDIVDTNSKEISCCPTSHIQVKSQDIPNSCSATTPAKQPIIIRNNCTAIRATTQENLYESITNLKCCSPKPSTLAAAAAMIRLEEAQNELANYSCRECSSQCPLIDISAPSTVQQVITKPRKLMRKSRSKRQKTTKSSQARVRSLSVGNENCYRNASANEVPANIMEAGGEECLNNLRRNDLIDIIRESMEKNRLCFQSNGKTTVSPTRHRHRSHTISKFVGEQHHIHHQDDLLTSNHSRANRCGYDSFLHATICTNNQSASQTPNNSPIRMSTPIKVLQNYNNRAIRARHKSNDIPSSTAAVISVVAASPQLQGYTKLNSNHHQSKLNTTMLSQLNPQLTPEQKISRTINHVEKWLTERDQVLVKTNNIEQRALKLSEESKLKMKEIAKDEKNLDNLINTKMFVDKLKMAEKFTEKYIESPTKKTFNKEVLLARRGVNTGSTPTKLHRNGTKTANLVATVAADVIKGKGPVMEYASVPIIVDPSECENLLRASCSDDGSCSQVAVETSPGGSSTAAAPGECPSMATSATAAAAAGGGAATASSAGIHRYVHEHIHHHYHHFENSGEIL